MPARRINRHVVRRLGARIRLLRIAREMRQEDLAERLNSSPEYVSDLERGTKTPSLALLYDLADALGTTIDELVRHTDGTPDETRLQEECIELVDRTRQDIGSYMDQTFDRLREGLASQLSRPAPRKGEDDGDRR